MKAGRHTKRSASGKQNSLLQLKATLKGVHPPVWRQLVVDQDTTLGELHDILQVALGWENSHLHQFRMGECLYGPKGPEYEDLDGWDDMEDENAVRLRSLVSPGVTFQYEYDLGDSWDHEIEVEKVLPATAGAVHPRCLAGARACPPEDCGGPPGYEDLLAAIRNPSHARHDELLEWLGAPFDPERFDLTKINRELAALGR